VNASESIKQEDQPSPGISDILQRNKEWVKQMNNDDPSFFERNKNGQKPKYLWIGCSDSRVPAESLMGLLPGQVFVHRNLANMVISSDINVLSVIQYAVEA